MDTYPSSVLCKGLATSLTDLDTRQDCSSLFSRRYSRLWSCKLYCGQCGLLVCCLVWTSMRASGLVQPEEVSTSPLGPGCLSWAPRTCLLHLPGAQGRGRLSTWEVLVRSQHEGGAPEWSEATGSASSASLGRLRSACHTGQPTQGLDHLPASMAASTPS